MLEKGCGHPCCPLFQAVDAPLTGDVLESGDWGMGGCFCEVGTILLVVIWVRA